MIAETLADLQPAKVAFEHNFKIPGVDGAIRAKARRFAPYESKFIQCKIQQMLQNAIVVPCMSPHTSPIVLVDQKSRETRFCINYGKINFKMIPDAWPLPRIDEPMERLAGSSYFTTLDLFSGYWQIGLAEECKAYTALTCKYGSFKFSVTPFGLMNAPAAFQRLMDQTLQIFPFVCAYVDYIVIYSPDIPTHKRHVATILAHLQRTGLKLKLSKCLLIHEEIKLLGHRVSNDGVAVDEKKTEVLKNYPTATTRRDVQAFLG